MEILNLTENYRTSLKKYPLLKDGKIESQREEEFYLNSCSNDDSIIDRIFMKKDIRVRVKTMTVIESLPVTNADIPESLLSRLPMKDSSFLSLLTDSSDKINGQRKGAQNKSMID